MAQDDGRFQWPRWLGPVVKTVIRVSAAVVLAACVFVGVLAVGRVMNAMSPSRDTTVPAVGVVLFLLASAGLVISRRARR